MSDGYRWESHFPPFAPGGAVETGTDIDGNAIYVGRAKHNGHWITAKTICRKGVAYVPYGGKEHVKNVEEYEVIVVKPNHKHEWIARNGDDGIPEGAICMERPGFGWHGEILYVGRANYQGSQMTGKISKEHKCVFVPYGGKEHKITGSRSHDILIIKKDK